MKIIKYFFEFLIIVTLFLVFKILGFKLASNFGGFLGRLIGPFFRSKKKLYFNINNALHPVKEKEIKLIINKMWENYGRILSEYMFIKNFRNSKNDDFLEIENKNDFINLIKSKI